MGRLLDDALKLLLPLLPVGPIALVAMAPALASPQPGKHGIDGLFAQSNIRGGHLVCRFYWFRANGEMPDGSAIETFDDLYGRVVARVGSAQLVDREIDANLAGVWSGWVNGCREAYS